MVYYDSDYTLAEFIDNKSFY